MAGDDVQVQGGDDGDVQQSSLELELELMNRERAAAERAAERAFGE